MAFDDVLALGWPSCVRVVSTVAVGRRAMLQVARVSAEIVVVRGGRGGRRVQSYILGSLLLTTLGKRRRWCDTAGGLRRALRP